jgi:hypothetical protein
MAAGIRIAPTRPKASIQRSDRDFRHAGGPLHARINSQILWISLCTSSQRTRKPAIRKRFSNPPKE